MPAEFEDKIQQKMQEFSLEPSPQVWDDVSAALNKRKKRRVFAWWWLYAAGILLAGVGGWVIFKDKGDKIQDSRDKGQEIRNKIQDSRDKVKDSRDKVKDTRDKGQEASLERQETRNKTKEGRDKTQETSLGRQDTRGKAQDLRDKTQETSLKRQDKRGKAQDSRDKTKETRDEVQATSLGKENVSGKAKDIVLEETGLRGKAENDKIKFDKTGKGRKLNVTVLAGNGNAGKNDGTVSAAAKASLHHPGEINRTISGEQVAGGNKTGHTSVAGLNNKPTGKEEAELLKANSVTGSDLINKPAAKNASEPVYADNSVTTNTKSNASVTSGEQTVASSDSIKPKDSSSITKTQNKDAFTNAPVSPTVSLKKSKLKPSHWSLYFAGGTSSTRENDLFKSSFSSNSVNLSTPGSGGTGAVSGSVIPDSLKSLSASNGGFHITGGVQYQQNLHKRWTFYTGLIYSFTRNTQKTGSIKNNNLSLYDNGQFALNNSRADKSSIPYYYYGGNSNTLTNYAHWLEVPASIGYSFNPRSAVKVSINTGASIAWMFAYKWLLTDKTYNIYYYNKAYTNNLLVNWHAGISVGLPKQVVIGLQYKYSLSTVAKSYIQPPLYWSSTSLYITIPLFKK